MSLQLIPDVERLLVGFLLDQPEVTDIAGSHIVTELRISKSGDPPPNEFFPAVRVHRYSGSPVVGRPLWLDAALVQIDCWGGPKSLAWELAETCRAILSLRLAGTQPEGVVSSVDFGELRDEPDDTVPPAEGKARPRYLFTCTVRTHPNPLVPS